MIEDHQARLGELEAALGYVFRDRSILERALTHSSWRHEAMAREGGSDPMDNEPLEFLGDALIGFVIARTLFRDHPGAEEGFLTRARARLVSGRDLAAIARELELGRHLRLGKGEAACGGADKGSILENALEAVVAAILLDGGYRSAARVVNGLFRDRIRRLAEGRELAGEAKSELQELLQARALPAPVYRVRRESGRDHQKRFTVAVLTDGRELARAEGKSKKAAQRAAARRALDLLIRDGRVDEELVRSLGGRMPGEPEPPAEPSPHEHADPSERRGLHRWQGPGDGQEPSGNPSDPRDPEGPER